MAISAAEQAKAARECAGVRVREDLGLVRVSGDDRVAWLNGQLTNDVREAKDGRAVYALAVTVRGKIIADAWVVDRGEELAVLLPQAMQARVLESFEQQIIMEDVVLTPQPSTRVLSIQGPRSADVVAGQAEAYAADEFGLGGMLVLVDESALPTRLAALTEAAERLGGTALDPAGFELLRLRAGRGLLGIDFDEHNYPQEAGLKELAVSFNKGCYLGQEVVCTLENRGRLSKRLVRFEAAAGALPTARLELADLEGHAVGHITSVVHDPDRGHALGLAYIKAALASAGTPLRAGDCALSVVAPAGA
jgi:folate-binding protein YgfZ